MTKEEFLDHYDNDNQRFRDALDELLKEHAIEFAQYMVGIARDTVVDTARGKPCRHPHRTDEEFYTEWINQNTENK